MNDIPTSVEINNSIQERQEDENKNKGDKKEILLHPKLEEEGITKERLKTTVETLKTLLSLCTNPNVTKTTPKSKKYNVSIYQDKSLRELRKLLVEFTEVQQLLQYNGQSADEYISTKIKQRTLKRQKMAETKMQQNYINKSLLRRTRLENLNQLMNQEHETESTQLLIPDGVAAPDNNPLLLTNKEEKPTTEEEVKLPKLRSCYICKTRFRTLHFFYDQLCPTCAALNYEKRTFTSSQLFQNKIAIVTGARVKIGFQTALQLLRCGATVIATSRFPNATAKVYAQKLPSSDLKDRLHVIGLDLRDVVGIEVFVKFIQDRFHCVDILINNACQTVRKPAAFYKPLVKKELEIFQTSNDTIKNMLQLCHDFESFRFGRNLHPKQFMEEEDALTQSQITSITTFQNHSIATTTASSCTYAQTGLSHSANLSQTILMKDDTLQQNTLISTDINGHPIDLRHVNSWKLKLQQVSTPELLETVMINAMAPFILNSQLIQQMIHSSTTTNKYIINVSAMEGKFYRHKTPNHPHTNMAKAALNMLTRTSAQDLATQHHIYMNSVDTGWINDENPLIVAKTIAERNHFQTPIDELDAAMRVLDPVIIAERDALFYYGKFFKDYRETEW